MAQAVAVAEGDGALPAELRLAWDCERWSALPDAGGVMDQDAMLMHRMAALSNVYAAVVRARNAQGKEIHQLTRQERRILKWLMDEALWPT